MGTGLRKDRLGIVALIIALLTVSACQTMTTTPAASEPKSRFLVFFDSEDAGLGPEARGVVAEAASAVRAGPTRSVTVNGFADPRGDAAMNARLSQERATAVAKALYDLGVQRDLITTNGLGEVATTVPSSDLNPEGRRVEIVLVR